LAEEMKAVFLETSAKENRVSQPDWPVETIFFQIT
jgi:hypothetical protein